MFTMRKTFAAFLLLSFVFSFAGCANSSEPLYKSIVVDCANDEYSVSIEPDAWAEGRFEKENMKDQAVTFMGKTYTAAYRYSEIVKGNSYTIDFYKNEDLINFGLNSKTGKLVYINLNSREFLDTNPLLEDVDNPYENAIFMAKEVAAEYVDNLEEYTMSVDKPHVSSGEKNGVPYEVTYYGIRFTKLIQGYLSSDYIRISVTSKGTLAGISIYDIGVFDGVQLDFDPQLVEQSIAQKVEEVYQKISFKMTDYRIDEQRIVCAPNGTIYMVSNVTVTGIIGDSDIEETTGVEMLTVIGSVSK